MRSSIYKVGGALTEENADLYVQRSADAEVISHLEAMNYVLLIEPRQQGKTSMVNHLIDEVAFNNTWWGYVDVTTLDRTSESRWYRSLCSRLLSQWSALTHSDHLQPDMPSDVNSWRDFLSRFAARAREESRRLVIALDEIGAITFPGATLFFSVLREVYNARKLERQFRNLTFVLVGAFNPRDLINDDRISPFNIAQRVRLADFTRPQVQELVSMGGWPTSRSQVLADRIHYWTNGQPYLCQWICSRLGSTAETHDVDVCVARMYTEEENHFPPIVKRLNSDNKMQDYVSSILAGEKIKFLPTFNHLHHRLEILGILKADDEGFCIVRNRVYQTMLSSMMEKEGRKIPASVIERPSQATSSESSTTEQRHLQTQLSELTKRYDHLTERIAALDRDISRETDGDRRFTLNTRRQDFVEERDQLASRMKQIEEKLRQGSREQM